MREAKQARLLVHIMRLQVTAGAVSLIALVVCLLNLLPTFLDGPAGLKADIGVGVLLACCQLCLVLNSYRLERRTLSGAARRRDDLLTGAVLLVVVALAANVFFAVPVSTPGIVWFGMVWVCTAFSEFAELELRRVAGAGQGMSLEDALREHRLQANEEDDHE